MVARPIGPGDHKQVLALRQTVLVLRARSPVLMLLLENEPGHHAAGSILTRQSIVTFDDRDSAIDRV